VLGVLIFKKYPDLLDIAKAILMYRSEVKFSNILGILMFLLNTKAFL